ncbi:MAG: hypothetical protein GXY55_09400 [Phycisphaerae bacterium]|nr:hypothetical protein [Phycisphaerae bacterium]
MHVSKSVEPINWISLTALVKAGAFSGRPASAARQARRWAAALSPAFADRRGGDWYLSPEARLPNGQPARLLLECGPRPNTLGGLVLPPGADLWSEADRERFLNTAALLRRFDAFTAERPTLSLEACAALFAADAQHARWAAERKLSVTYRAMARYRLRMTPGSSGFDGNIDARGRKRASDDARAATCSPDAWAYFQRLYLTLKRVPISEAHRETAAVAKAEGWAWPSLRTVQLRVQREIPLAEKVYMRRGEQAFRGEVVPKLRRDYSDVLAGTHWIGDERTCDFWVRVPCHRAGWRLVRPKLTAWMDARSRVFVGWTLGVLANSDTILAAFKTGAVAWGLPSDVTIDNGADYRAVGGRRARRGWNARDASREAAAFEHLGVHCHYAEVRAPWAKSIESAFRTLAIVIDKGQPLYCGGTPDARPADLEKRKRDVMAAPTLEEAIEATRVGLADYHARPHSGEGMNGFTPNLAMAQFRGPIRKADAAVLDLLCARLVGPVKVGRDGVRWQGVLYGNYDPALRRYQGEKVWLRLLPDRAEAVVVCDQAGRPLVEVTNARLRGVTQEEVRAAAQHRKRAMRQIRERANLVRTAMETKVETAARLKAKASMEAEKRTRQYLEPPPAPEVTLVRPDLTAAAQKIGKRRRAAAAQEDPEARAIRDIMAEMETLASQYDLGNEAGAAAARRRADADLADFDALMDEPPRREVAG